MRGRSSVVCTVGIAVLLSAQGPLRAQTADVLTPARVAALRAVGAALVSPDGARIVCVYQLNAAAPQKLISVKTTGFPVVRADLFEPAAGHNIGVYRVSPDSQWVVFSDYPSSGLDSFLRAVPTAGGSPLVIGPGIRRTLRPIPRAPRAMHPRSRPPPRSGGSCSPA